ncbi:MAG: primosomal protein N' [Dehalococcoidia bacterium]|nr:primosomal protein N' [Dehalococcoidia bacterium]
MTRAAVEAPGRLKYVKVAVNSGRLTYLTFSYAVPADREIAPGEVVHAPFGARTLQGVVVDGPFDTPGYDPDEVRPLEPVVEGAPRISPPRMALARWLQDYYLAPPWEAHALFLPPGAGERPETTLVRADIDGPPEALSDTQQAVYQALGDEPVELGELKRTVHDEVPARRFDAALTALVRRGLVERHYALARPRGRARMAEVVRLGVSGERAREFADGIEGRRTSRRARAIRALVAAGGGPLPFATLAKEARGAPAVETLIAEGVLTRIEDEVRLAIEGNELARLLRVLSRSQADQAAATLLERLAAMEEEGAAPVLPARGLAREVGQGAREAVRRLEAGGFVAVEEVLERRDPLRHLTVVRRPSVELIADQRVAAAAIRAAVDGHDGSGFVLQGVTGSGKTEVYLDALQHAVDGGRRGIVLVPEIALTPQTVRRFAERFPGRVGVLHSGLTLGEAYDEWHEIARGAYDVVIGSRSAVFAPQPDLGLIVVDEAHEWTYKQSDPAPRYDARRVATELARQSGAALVFGSATPDVERWYAATEEVGDLTRLDLPRRIRPVPQPDGTTRLWPVDDLPQVDVIDMRGSHQLFSNDLVMALGEVLDRDEQAILFLNRRGVAGYLLCPRGHSPTCSACDVSLALHEGNRLICHQCGRGRRLPARCEESACGMPLRQVSAGTQRVEREVRLYYPTARVVRWDRDTARTAEQHEAILGQFVRQEADVLVGTQMVAKGLDLPMVTLVGVVLADYTLREGDFRSRERGFQLLVQVAGRAGRADRHGRVLVQTLQPEAPAIIAAAAHDVDRFYEEELAWRADHGYPPFRNLVRLVFSHTNGAYAIEEASRMAEELRALAAGLPDIEVRGPTPPQVARVRGRHRWSILLRGDDPASLVRSMDELPPGWVVDVDPMVVT